MKGRVSSIVPRARLRRAGLSLGVAAALFTAFGCGQTGPLTLPEPVPAASGESEGRAPSGDGPEAQDAHASRDER